VRRYYRSDDGRLVAGVARGMAEHLGVSVNVIRGAFVLLTVAGGAGLLMYAAFWALVPLREPVGIPRRANLNQFLGYGLLGLGGVLFANAIGLGIGPATSWPVFVAAAGAALIWRQADVTQRSRWLATARTRQWPPSPETLLRLVVGSVLLVAGLSGFLISRGSLSQTRNAVLAGAAVVAGTAVVAGPWLIRMANDLASERRERIRTQERAEIAARVHDSVLHTLALIQRNIDDPREVARLARAQERDLRSWLYAGESTDESSVAGALRSAAAEVEDAHGVSVDVVAVGDCELDEPLRPIVQATREAVTNAAKHAGTGRVDVYAEVSSGAVDVFVRDRGAGFVLDDVPEDRYGVRRSILDRMERHGGTAEVRSTPGEGTEVRLHLPRPHSEENS
jgi:signal transduction histidine kinase